MASSRMLALLGLLAVAGYQNRDRLGALLERVTGRGSADPSAGLDNDSPRGDDPSARNGDGGFLGALGNLFGGSPGSGAAGGGILGGLGDLIESFTGRNDRTPVNTWVRTGPNQTIEATELEEALGEDTIDALTRQTGLTRDELVRRLQTVLPTAVDKLTPDGRVPTETEAANWRAALGAA